MGLRRLSQLLVGPQEHPPELLTDLEFDPARYVGRLWARVASNISSITSSESSISDGALSAFQPDSVGTGGLKGVVASLRSCNLL
jgi:hypothetical protein